MDNQTRRVLIGWLNLNPSQQRDFIRNLNAYIKMSAQEQQVFEVQLEVEEIAAIKMAIGPLGDPCPCCGK